MHPVTARLVLSLALVCSACGAPQLPGEPGIGRIGAGWGCRATGPAVACDRFGRCWEVGPFDRHARGDIARPDAQPPGWAENLPGSAGTDDRFLRPRSEVVCDRATRICYKRGKVDQSDTDDVFGERAGDRVDALGAGTARHGCSCRSGARPATASAASASRTAIRVVV